ncbi:nicotinamide-nucleotide adenylyltransferase [Ignicoccus pacificus DSM 13166]|uniref:Nicotinamide-nucleotide adenylyltransferase n=1 Tax=Ignicoccus pacificus DSM 13166 TaxID=940294 RepID=A0A977K9F8_9CREN|nr:nicotinamide-nucleotide adenylyltransferase [Ignicoccus pacificus DSM 13166]
MKVLRAVIPGRFQPFHKGHLQLVKWTLERVNEAIIVIGSAQESHTLQNPMTAGERILAIRKGLECEGVDLKRIYLIPVPDILMNSAWVAHVKTYVPPFQYVVSRNPLVKILFEEAGYSILEPPPFDREKYVATNIRLMMIKGEEWKNYIPRCTAEVIEELKIPHRLKKLMERD